MVSGDVFRPPQNATLLCVQVGSGVQIIASAFMTLFFAALGMLSIAADTPESSAPVPCEELHPCCVQCPTVHQQADS